MTKKCKDDNRAHKTFASNRLGESKVRDTKSQVTIRKKGIRALRSIGQALVLYNTRINQLV